MTLHKLALMSHFSFEAKRNENLMKQKFDLPEWIKEEKSIDDNSRIFIFSV